MRWDYGKYDRTGGKCDRTAGMRLVKVSLSTHTCLDSCYV